MKTLQRNTATGSLPVIFKAKVNKIGIIGETSTQGLNF
jgi:hypothetical protein